MGKTLLWIRTIWQSWGLIESGIVEAWELTKHHLMILLIWAISQFACQCACLTIRPHLCGQAFSWVTFVLFSSEVEYPALARWWWSIGAGKTLWELVNTDLSFLGSSMYITASWPDKMLVQLVHGDGKLLIRPPFELNQPNLALIYLLFILFANLI